MNLKLQDKICADIIRTFQDKRVSKEDGLAIAAKLFALTLKANSVRDMEEIQDQICAVFGLDSKTFE